jgi:hypothetical protein
MVRSPLIIKWCFGVTCRLYHQDRRIDELRNQHSASCNQSRTLLFWPLSNVWVSWHSYVLELCSASSVLRPWIRGLSLQQNRFCFTLCSAVDRGRTNLLNGVVLINSDDAQFPKQWLWTTFRKACYLAEVRTGFLRNHDQYTFYRTAESADHVVVRKIWIHYPNSKWV